MKKPLCVPQRGFSLSINPLYGVRGSFTQGGARGGKARLESDQMSRKALPCKACVERSDYFRAARRHKNNDIISGCRKSLRLLRQPEAVNKKILVSFDLSCVDRVVKRGYDFEAEKQPVSRKDDARTATVGAELHRKPVGGGTQAGSRPI